MLKKQLSDENKYENQEECIKCPSAEGHLDGVVLIRSKSHAARHICGLI